MVSFVDNDQIYVPYLRFKPLQQVLASQRLHGDDRTKPAPIRVLLHARYVLLERTPVEDLEILSELPVKFFLPLVSQTRRTNDENLIQVLARFQFSEDQTRLDGLAKSDLIG